MAKVQLKPASRSVPDELGRGRNNVRTQRVLRSAAQEPLETLHSDRFVNALEFEAYNYFLKADNYYAGHVLYETPYVSATMFAVFTKYSVTEKEMKGMNLAAFQASLTYLSEPQSRLLTRDDFRLVFRHNSPRGAVSVDRSLGCALAGVTGLDLVRIYRSLAPGLDVKDVHERPRCTDRQLLDACKRDGLIGDYASSGRLIGVRGLNEYLRQNAGGHRTLGANLILSQYADGGGVCGHAVVIKYFIDAGTYERNPQKVLIDFQVPGMMRVTRTAGPNPLRFTTHVDTATYSTFVVHAIYPRP